MDFRTVIKMSFFNVKRDMSVLKQHLYDWINYLNNNQQILETKITELENKLVQLENNQKKEIIIK